MPEIAIAPPTDESSALRLRTAAILLFAAFNLGVFAVRLNSIWHYGDLFETTGVEYIAIYSVWERMHHIVVYRWPFVYPFSLSIYNYLFYDFYALILRLLGAPDRGIETCGRMLTSVFGLIAAVFQWRLVVDVLKLRGWNNVLSLVLALGTWFCASLVRWRAISVRPDIGAVACVMAGLWFVVKRPRYGFVLAGLCFYFAWAFKQSVVFTLIGVCLYLTFERKWRELLPLLGVFTTLVVITLSAGSDAYRFSIFVAPKLVPGFSISASLHLALRALSANFYWVLSPLFLISGRNRKALPGERQFLLFLMGLSLLGGLAAMTKIGASDNYLFETFLAGTTLLQIALFSGPVRLVSTLLLAGCIQPALQLGAHLVGSQSLGNLQLTTPSGYAQALHIRNELMSMPRPLFLEDGILAMPWIVPNGGTEPVVIDPVFFRATRLRQENGGIEGMLRRGEFRTVMLSAQNFAYQRSLNSEYKVIASEYHQGGMYTIYVLGD